MIFFPNAYGFGGGENSYKMIRFHLWAILVNRSGVANINSHGSSSEENMVAGFFKMRGGEWHVNRKGAVARKF